MNAIFKLFSHPYTLLVMTTLFWAGNAIAGKLSIEVISPMFLVFIRWLITAIIMITFNYRLIKIHKALLFRHWRIFSILAIFGYVGFNTLFYFACNYTPAINIGILQGFIPIIVILIGTIFFQQQFHFIQLFGVSIGIIGVIIVIAGGDWAQLLSISFNFGDILMLVACLFYALYTLVLKNRPSKMESLLFFTFLSIFACLLSIPGFVYEVVTEQYYFYFNQAIWLILYVSIFPSCIAQILFIFSVEKIGSAKASVFINLVPLFSACLSIIILQEKFLLFHFFSLLFIILGIIFTQQNDKKLKIVFQRDR